MIKEFVFGALAISAIAFPGINSGLNVGESVTPFHPSHVTGPDKGTDTCPPCKYGARPAVQVWVNGDSTENIAKLASVLNQTAGKNENFKGFVIWVSDNKDQAAGTLKTIAGKHNFDAIGMAVIDPKNEAINNYKINLDKEVKNTVIVYKNKKVVQKFVNWEANEKGLNELNGAIAGVSK